jgi:Zn-dependent protease with chaperone function
MMFRADVESFIAKSNVRRFVSRRKIIFQLLTALLVIWVSICQSLPITLNVYASDECPGQRSARLLNVNSEAIESTPGIAAIEEEKLIQKVSKTLLAAADVQANKYLKQYAWPPTFHFVDSNTLNAYASIAYKQKSGPIKCPIDGKTVCRDHILNPRKGDDGDIWIVPKDRKTDKYFPHVVVYKPLMSDLIEGDVDRLAFVLSHELGHILLGHILPTSPARTAKTPALRTIFTAGQEHDADAQGMRLALAAGYSVQGARELWLKLSSDEFLEKHPGFNYTSFEGTGADHPAWADRLELIDKDKQSLWKAMSAFENGVFFAQVQQYDAAQVCFERVVQEFPESYEAWANLGYARLMLYFDAFDHDDLANFDVGQIEVGSFYARPDTLRQQVRGINKRLWEKTSKRWSMRLS